MLQWRLEKLVITQFISAPKSLIVKTVSLKSLSTTCSITRTNPVPTGLGRNRFAESAKNVTVYVTQLSTLKL